MKTWGTVTYHADERDLFPTSYTEVGAASTPTPVPTPALKKEHPVAQRRAVVSTMDGVIEKAPLPARPIQRAKPKSTFFWLKFGVIGVVILMGSVLVTYGVH